MKMNQDEYYIKSQKALRGLIGVITPKQQKTWKNIYRQAIELLAIREITDESEWDGDSHADHS